MVKKCKKTRHLKLVFKKQLKVFFLMEVPQHLLDEEKSKVILGKLHQETDLSGLNLEIDLQAI
jgi:hypothetical protein